MYVLTPRDFETWQAIWQGRTPWRKGTIVPGSNAGRDKPVPYVGARPSPGRSDGTSPSPTAGAAPE